MRTKILAFQGVTPGYFDWEKRGYKRIQVGEQLEVLSLAGEIAFDRGEPGGHVSALVKKRYS